MTLKFTGERCIPEFMRKHTGIYQEHLARYNFALSFAKDKKVLDAACGCGFGASMLYNVAERVTGVDVDPETIDYARENFNGFYKVEDLNKWSMVDDSFDLVVSFETIEHLENPEMFVESVWAHSKEFLFSVPINDGGKFHKTIYKGVEDIEPLIKTYFGSVKWYYQRGINIGTSNNKSKYLIGHAV